MRSFTENCADENITGVMQPEDDPRQRHQHSERHHDPQQFWNVTAKKDRETDSVQRMARRKTVTIERCFAANDFAETDERAFAYQPALELLVSEDANQACQ